MDMTVGMFNTYLERIQLQRTNRMMDMAQSSIYAQLTNESRRQLWNGWTQTVSAINHVMLQKDAIEQGKQLFTWNGMSVGLKGLKNKFIQTWGSRSTRR